MSDWQPIETAPKDGTEILGYGGYPEIAVMRWRKAEVYIYTRESYGEWVYAEYSDEYNHTLEVDNPTHWMPLPDPPKAVE